MQCVIGENPHKKRYTLVFRGSESVWDWLYDLMVIKTTIFSNVSVHRGFYKQLMNNQTYYKISQYMQVHHKENIEKHVPFFRKNNKKVSYNASTLLSSEIKDVFFNGEFSECRIVYAKFKSVLNQQVEDIKLLPLQIDEIENLSCFAKSDKEIFEFDNNLEIILEKLIQNYINATVLHVYSNSLTCEYSARMLAMDSATKNSDKMLKELNLLYNRSRQAIITKELIEIISGAEATN